jgi:hypothetical protein
MNKIVFEEYFDKSEGKPFIYNGKEVKMSDRIQLSSNKVALKVSFVSTDSEWKQGIVFQTKGEFEINDIKIPTKIVLWEDTAPKELQLLVKSKDKVLFVYNVWDTGDSTMHYGHNGAAMCIEKDNSSTLYNCNDGHPDDDFSDLIFKIEFL